MPRPVHLTLQYRDKMAEVLTEIQLDIDNTLTDVCCTLKQICKGYYVYYMHVYLKCPVITYVSEVVLWVFLQ